MKNNPRIFSEHPLKISRKQVVSSKIGWKNPRLVMVGGFPTLCVEVTALASDASIIVNMVEKDMILDDIPGDCIGQFMRKDDGAIQHVIVSAFSED